MWRCGENGQKVDWDDQLGSIDDNLLRRQIRAHSLAIRLTIARPRRLLVLMVEVDVMVVTTTVGVRGYGGAIVSDAGVLMVPAASNERVDEQHGRRQIGQK